ncbi:MAG: helix-turn-helix domain-containing protein [Proteobacteria bacterium]|nr:helix-turn-helix domain-containing protein [Pseudomonadota bacterium]
MNSENTTNQIPAAQRLDFFDSLVSQTFFPMSCEPCSATGRDFQGTVCNQQLGEVGFAAVRSSPLDVHRRRSHIAQVSDAAYLVKVQVAGEGIVRQRGKEAHLRPGDFALCLSSEPYDLHFASDYSQVVLAVPQALLEECVSQPAQYLGLRMDGNVGANGLFSQFVTSIAQRLDTLDGVLAQRLETNVIDLLSTTLGYAQEGQKREFLKVGVKCEYIQRIKHFIRRNLDSEDLSPDNIAAAHDISTRYLHMLFSDESMSVSRYILQLRLEHCRAALSDAAFADYSVSEIAYRFGFNDASHFSRAFKSEYQQTPARFRKNNKLL